MIFVVSASNFAFTWVIPIAFACACGFTFLMDSLPFWDKAPQLIRKLFISKWQATREECEGETRDLDYIIIQ